MAININSNISSLQAGREIDRQSSSVNKASERLSSGRQINSAADDAAGLAIAVDLLADAGISSVASKNVSDGVSLSSIAEGSLGSASDITIRLSELAAQASNGTLSDQQRLALDNEFQALSGELDRISQTTEFNGQQLLSSDSNFTLQVGTDSSESSQISLRLPGVSSEGLGITANLRSAESARQAVEQVDQATETISSARGEIGSVVSRLETAFDNLRVSEQGQQEAASRILDADVATEASNLISARVREQAATAIGAQANQAPAQALELLS